jgi:hypothetical protein
MIISASIKEMIEDVSFIVREHLKDVKFIVYYQEGLIIDYDRKVGLLKLKKNLKKYGYDKVTFNLNIKL